MGTDTTGPLLTTISTRLSALERPLDAAMQGAISDEVYVQMEDLFGNRLARLDDMLCDETT